MSSQLGQHSQSHQNDIIHLNVGGTFYTTSLSTLRKYPGSMLGAMFSGKMNAGRTDDSNRFFIDRDGDMFRHVLNFMRSSRLNLPEDFKDIELLQAEADFYQIEDLIDAIQTFRHKQAQRGAARGVQGHYLEVIEVRSGVTATMPTNNSRIKTILSGRKDMLGRNDPMRAEWLKRRSLKKEIMSLPIIGKLGESQLEKLHYFGEMDYPEVELLGSNIRLKLGEYLRGAGWQLVDSSMSSSSVLDPNSNVSAVYIEHSYRDRWYLQLRTFFRGAP